PGEPRDLLRRGFEKAPDVAAAGEMLADGAQHDDAHALIGVQRLERGAHLVALRHRDDVERRPVEGDVGAPALRGGLDPEAVQLGEAGRREGLRAHAAFSCPGPAPGSRSASYSPATSLRRSSLPTGDLGSAATNT